jgi:beta-N-acetylhexosaminidase
MGVSRRRIALRRAAALLLAAGATALIALAIAGEEDEDRATVTGISGGVPPAVRGLVRALSLEERVDQVLALGFSGTDAASPILEDLRERQIGAVFVAAENWLDASQAGALIAELEQAGGGGGRVPPLILAAQEGGSARAFGDIAPGRRAVVIGELGDPQGARQWARAAGEAMAAAGVDMNLAPLLDLAPLSSPLAERVFSEDPGLTARMGLAAQIGCGEAGIACAPAHFPGMGGASADTDLGPATVGLDRATLLRRDLVPFKVSFQAGAPAVVLSHAFFASFEAVTPASQVPAIVTRLLRERLRFQGVAITDDLSAGAIAALGPIRDAAVAALAAGADLLLIERAGEAQEVTRAALLRAVRSGEVPRARLDEAAGRVLRLKQELGIL